MTGGLEVLELPGQVTVQDAGRSGTLGFGLSRGGAVDRRAMAEGAALLGQGAELAALELAGMGGAFRARGPLRIALSGAAMTASIDSAPVRWHACHALADGQVLRIGAARVGVYGYLSLGGGIAVPEVLGSRSENPLAGVGTPLRVGEVLPVGPDLGGPVGLGLDGAGPERDRTIRVLRGPQTGLFTDAMLARFAGTAFRRDARSNRQAVRLAQPGEGFSATGGLSVVSDFIVPGDIQITGDGTPFVLMPDCQTTGGYPRLGTVLPCDLARVAQAGPGDTLRFEFVDLEAGQALEATALRELKGLARRVSPLVRDPATIPDLLRYQLVGGVTTGADAD